MALKLRRGTEANRTSITPAEGEIIYVTDTKKLYVGDGTTPGGVLQGGSGAGSLTGITDTATASVLSLSDANIGIDVDLSITGQEIVGDGDINITGDITASGAGTGIITANRFIGDITGAVSGAVTGNVTGDVAGNTTGYHTGDMTGSVFGNDSTVIVDGTSNTLNGNIDNINTLTYATPLTITNKTDSTANINFVNNAAASSMGLTIKAEDEKGLLTFIRNSTSDLSGDDVIYGGVYFGVDDSNGRTDTALMLGYKDKLVWAVDEGGTPPELQHMIFNSDGNLGVGTFTPTSKLDVAGDVKIGSFTTAERDALTGANGMMIYNTTNSRFQIFEAGNWLNMREVSSGGGGSTDNYSHWNITADDSTLRVVNGQETIGILGGAGITTASDSEGNITITGTVVDFTDLGVTPTTLAGYGITDALQVGSAFDVTGDLTGSVFADDSSTMIDGAAGKIVGPIESTDPVLTGTIDSSDSSAITFVPALVMNSDVTIENNLIVTNKIVADTIEVENIITNASGTPEISSDTDIILAAGTRVEVSTSPFKLASYTTTERDALTPENGDTIYNNTTDKFQGYAGGAWVDLH